MMQLLAFILIILSVNDLTGTGRFTWEKNLSEGVTWHHLQACVPEESQTMFSSFKLSKPGSSPRVSPNHSSKASPLLALSKTIDKHRKGSNRSLSKSQDLSSAYPVVIEIVDSPEQSEYDFSQESSNENSNALAEFDYNTEGLGTSPESNSVPDDSIAFEVAGLSIVLKNSSGIDPKKLSRDGDKILYWSRPFYVERVWDFHGNELEIPNKNLPIFASNKIVRIETQIGEVQVELQNSTDIKNELLCVRDDKIVYFPPDLFAPARLWDFSGNEC